MRKVLIIGATSAIAEAVARRFAYRGDRLCLVGRNAEALQIIAADLTVRGASSVSVVTLDVCEFAAHKNALDEAEQTLDGFDIVLIAHGILPDQSECQRDPAAVRKAFEVNAMSTLALLTDLANRLEKTGAGTLAAISSIAGDRGRQSNYVYGSAKAAVSVFLSGLRQRLAKVGVNVITIKPGFVDTPMTTGFAKNRLWATPDEIAKGIVKAIDRRKVTVYLPWYWHPIALLVKCIPEFLFKKIKL